MEYEKLCRAVERELHREMKTPQDFDYLSEQVMKRLSESVSPTTLMRLWGYRPSVKTRYSTLDILSRFIGFDDYTQFLVENMEIEPEPGEVSEAVPADPLPSPTPKRRWLWALVAVLGAVLLAVGAYLYISRPVVVPEPVYVTSLDQLSNQRQYYIHTRDKKRGSLGIDSHQLASTYSEAHFYRCDTASTFALVHFEDSYYMYSVQRHRFINIMHAETDDPMLPEYMEKNWCALDIRPEEGHFVIDRWANHAAGRVFTLNVNSGNGLIITDWGTMNGIYDDGNLFSFEDAGPFDPSEALQMLRRSKEKNAVTPA
ncbi:MAG: hypothetical protein IJ064_02035 [Bacteroidaceae bacterium]|nr:hypothetical protein [Bacteroidaceae bacterium]